jgi:hypothetical protein
LELTKYERQQAWASSNIFPLQSPTFGLSHTTHCKAVSSSLLHLMLDSPTRSEKVIFIDLFLQRLSNFSIFLLFSFQICSSQFPPSLKIYFPFLLWPFFFCFLCPFLSCLLSYLFFPHSSFLFLLPSPFQTCFFFLFFLFS